MPSLPTLLFADSVHEGIGLIRKWGAGSLLMGALKLAFPSTPSAGALEFLKSGALPSNLCLYVSSKRPYKFSLFGTRVAPDRSMWLYSHSRRIGVHRADLLAAQGTLGLLSGPHWRLRAEMMDLSPKIWLCTQQCKTHSPCVYFNGIHLVSCHGDHCMQDWLPLFQSQAAKQ